MDIKEALKRIPVTPGVYFFKDKLARVIYIGKAKNLSKRVSSYFHKKTHDPKTALLVQNIDSVDYVPTAREAEALIYEASFIRQYRPRFNIDLKDDSSYPYLKITHEKFPRLMITREVLDDRAKYFGPYTSVSLLREAFKLMKRVFPLRTCSVMPKKTCLDYDIKQCLGPCARADIAGEYREVISDLKLFLSGKKNALLDRLSERMNRYASLQDYERALFVRKQIDALSVVVGQSRHTLPLDSDLKILKDELSLKSIPARIEAFDISNIGGKYAVGSMVTFFNAQPLKSDYRKYRIKTVRAIDDYAMIKEIVSRRYSRLLREKKSLPDLILIDGGAGHLSAARDTLKELGVKTPVISIAKKNEEIYSGNIEGPLVLPKTSKALQLIQRVRDEAHRFAITYHKLLRKKGFFDHG